MHARCNFMQTNLNQSYITLIINILRLTVLTDYFSANKYTMTLVF